MLYKFWGGRYFSYILISVSPLYFNSIAAYKAVNLFLMLIFFFSLYILITELLKNYLSSKERIIFTLSILFLYLYGMDSVSQGFYWYGAVICYNVSIIFIMFFIAAFIRLKKSVSVSSKLFYTLIAVLCVFVTAGSTELGLVLIPLLLLLLFAKDYFEKDKVNPYFIIIAVFAILAVYLAVSAPGNNARANQYEYKHRFFDSVYNSSVYLFENIFSWITGTPLLIITFMSLPLMIKIISKEHPVSKTFAAKPLPVILSIILILFVLTFVMYWSVGITPYGRVLNFIYFIFLCGWFYISAVLFQYFRNKYKFNPKNLPKYSFTVSIILVCIFLFKQNNISTAYREIFNGTAKEYDMQLESRYNYIRESKSDTVEIASINKVPESFFLFDITTDPSIFYNQGYARYFNKEAIFLKKDQ